jgi:diaminopimelate epimerase
MPGGELQIEISADYRARLTGPVKRIADGEIAPEALA